MIEIFNIQKVYGTHVALSIDDLKIAQSDFIGLIGNNGAGKTTLLSLMLDLIVPTKGYVTSKSIKVSDSDDWKTYTGSFLNEGFLIPFLSPFEFLEFIGSLHGQNTADVKDFLEEKYFSIFNLKKFHFNLTSERCPKPFLRHCFIIQPSEGPSKRCLRANQAQKDSSQVSVRGAPGGQSHPSPTSLLPWTLQR